MWKIQREMLMVRHRRMPHEVAVSRNTTAGLMGARVVVAGGTPKRAELSLSPWTLAEVGREQGWMDPHGCDRD